MKASFPFCWQASQFFSTALGVHTGRMQSSHRPRGTNGSWWQFAELLVIKLSPPPHLPFLSEVRIINNIHELSERQWRTGKPDVLQSMGSQWVKTHWSKITISNFRLPFQNFGLSGSYFAHIHIVNQDVKNLAVLVLNWCSWDIKI